MIWLTICEVDCFPFVENAIAGSKMNKTPHDLAYDLRIRNCFNKLSNVQNFPKSFVTKLKNLMEITAVSEFIFV